MRTLHRTKLNYIFIKKAGTHVTKVRIWTLDCYMSPLGVVFTGQICLLQVVLATIIKKHRKQTEVNGSSTLSEDINVGRKTSSYDVILNSLLLQLSKCINLAILGLIVWVCEVSDFLTLNSDFKTFSTKVIVHFVYYAPLPHTM